MEKMLVVLQKEPTTDSVGREVTSYRFVFKKTPVSKIGSVEEPAASSIFNIRLKVSNILMAKRRWPEVSHLNRIKCFFCFIRDELQEHGVPGSPVKEMELRSGVKDAVRLPEIHD